MTFASHLSLVALLAATPALAGAPIAPPSAPFSPVNAIPGATNFDPAILPHARIAMAKVRAGAGRMKIAFIGDSTFAGQGGGTGGTNNTTAGRNASVPNDVTKLLAAAGVPSIDGFFSDGALGSLGDTRITYGAGWSMGPGTLGGGLFQQNTTTGTALALTPASPINNCDVYYINAGSPGQFTIDYSGAGTITISPIGGLGMVKQSISPPLGSYTLNIKATNVGATTYIAGVDCYNTTTPQVSVWNWGIAGSQSSSFTNAANSWETLNALGTYAPDLTIIDIGINDEGLSVAYATFYANVQTVITKAKLSGDVILVMHHDDSRAAQASVTLPALKALSAANNLPLVNFASRLGSFAQANSLGEMYDALHGNATGYADEAKMIANLLLQL